MMEVREAPDIRWSTLEDEQSANYSAWQLKKAKILFVV
jgi:hypothetical protein